MFKLRFDWYITCYETVNDLCKFAKNQTTCAITLSPLNPDHLCYSGYQSHVPSNDFFTFQKVRFGGRQSNVSMTITESAVTGTTISMSILRVFDSLFHLYLTRRKTETEK